MLKFITVEALKGYKKKKIETEQSKIMGKYAQLNRFHRDRQLEDYKYAFMYVDPEAMTVEDHFPGTKQCVEN